MDDATGEAERTGLRVVAKVEWHPGELYPRVGFIVTNLHRPAKKVVAFYNGRGTAEQWIKEGKNAIKWTRLSCTAFRANAVRLQLHALAYNLANFLLTLALPGEIAQWSLTTLREKVVKIGAKVVAHGRYLVFQMAEVAVPRELFRGILHRIAGLRPPRRGPMLTREGLPPPQSQGRGVSGARPVTAIRGQELPWRAASAAFRLESGRNEPKIACRVVPRPAMDRPEGGFAPSIWEMSAKIFFKKVVAPIFFNQPANDAEIKKAADEELPPLFDYLESQLGAGPFIVGPQFSIGDLGIATQFVNLRLAGFGVDPARWAKLARYVAAVHERPSFKPLIAEEKASLGIA